MSPQSKSFGEKLLLIFVSALVSALVTFVGSAYASARQSGADKSVLDQTAKQTETNTHDIKELQITVGEVKAMRDQINAVYTAVVGKQ